MSQTFDWVLAPMYFIIFFSCGLLLKKRLTKNFPYLCKYYTPALLIKFLGALLSIWFYDFYLNGSDMTGYYRGSLAVSNAFWSNIYHFIEIFTTNAKSFSTPVYQYFIDTNIAYYMDSEKTVRMCRIGGLLSIITFNSIYGIGAILSLVSFISSWLVLRVFCSIYPLAFKGLSCSILFIPSVIFWGTSPLMRDTMVLIFLNFSFNYIYKIFILKQQKKSNILLLIISLYFMFTMKIYVAMSFIPSAVIWVMLFNKKRRVYRYSFNKFVKIIGGLFLGMLFLILISSFANQYKLSNLFTYAKNVQVYHTHVTEITNGSGYSFGNYDSSISKFITVVPKSINVSLYRPYLWEVRKASLIPSSIESAIFLITSILFIFKYKLRFFKILRKESTVLFCFIFSLTFFFAIGFSTYNFGSLVRYKIQALPFFFSGLSIIHYYLRETKKIQL